MNKVFLAASLALVAVNAQDNFEIDEPAIVISDAPAEEVVVDEPINTDDTPTQTTVE